MLTIDLKNQNGLIIPHLKNILHELKMMSHMRKKMAILAQFMVANDAILVVSTNYND
jgi:hypothetical protein